MTLHLTTALVAERLGKSRDTVLRLVDAGELPAEKMPGKTGTFIFRADDVEAYVAKRAAELTAAAAELSGGAA